MRLGARELALLSVVLSACTTSSGPPAGSERGPCYGNGTCDAPLRCLSNVCVLDASDAGTGDAGSGDDASTGVDASAQADAGSDAGQLPERRTYVASDLVTPTNAASANALGLDLDGDGTVDNAVGQFLASLAALGSETDANGPTQLAVDQGEIILLFEAEAISFTNGSLDARALRGSDPTPAACTNPTDPTTCRQHLAGSGSFTVVAPAPARLAGELTSGTFDVGPGDDLLPIAFSAAPTWLPIAAARIHADVDATGLTHGVYAGAIRSADVDATLVPALHAPIAEAVARDCSGGTCTSGSAGASYVSFFDADHDGTVTLDEFRTNALIMATLALDLDLFDASGAPGTDGSPDALSIGIGFTAVGATFVVP